MEALNMQLESVRTVLKNQVNEIKVCADLKRSTGVFYTVISITSAEVRRQIAGRIATAGLFTTNSDYMGSYTAGDALNLVFLYRPESRLSSREAMYATTFRDRKQMAESLVVASAETQITGSVGMLLLAERNINIAANGTIYFNYFLDFGDWKPENDEGKFFGRLAENTFELLAREYAIKYDGQIWSYPSELQLFYKKLEAQSFQSFNAILAFVKMISDQPREPRKGLGRVLEKLKDGYGYLREHSMAIFLAVIVLATALYAGYQVVTRISLRSAAEKKTVYIGLDTIGETYLGDENV